MAAGALILCVGAFCWTILEYAIHGLMGHRFTTFVGPLHEVHHRDPHAVFAIGAWPAVAIVWLAGLMVFGAARGMILLTGIVGGFIAYEILHYRMHFSQPANRWEKALRLRHLVHHYAAPEACFGVTTRLWDVVLGSEPGAGRMEELEAQVDRIEPLGGRSNLTRVVRLGGGRR